MDNESAHYAVFSMICTDKYRGNKTQKFNISNNKASSINYFPIARKCVPKIHINIILKYPTQSSLSYSHAQHLWYEPV